MTTETGTIRVCLMTTEALVEIQQITPFPEQASTSTMCRNGTKFDVGVDRDYHAFVRSPTGCIERLFGHGRFRLDVSHAVDAGSSWELAVLLAHAAFAKDRLAQSLHPGGAPPDILICATGQIRPLDLAVGEVAEVRRKVSLATPDLLAARAAGQRVLLAVPLGNIDDIAAPDRSALTGAGVEILAVENARDLADVAGLALPRRAMAAARHYTPGQNPYRGLLPFRPEDRDVFFGRRRAREELLLRLRTATAQGVPFVLVHGRSGIGKSSLLQAGLAGDVVERLAHGAKVTVVHHVCRPAATGATPSEELLRALAAGATTVTEVVERLPDDTRVLLLLDQLEQALIDLPDSQGRVFGEVLRDLVASQRVWVAAAIRTDQLDALDRAPALAKLARDSRTYRLEPPTPFELTEMILQPALRAGLSFEPGPHGESLPEILTQIAYEAPGSVPLLQVMLMRLAAMADTEGRIGFSAYAALGGFDQAVARLAEEALESLPAGASGPVSGQDIEHALSGLIQMDSDGSHILSRTVNPRGESPAISRILAHLVDRRILVSEVGPDAVTTVRPAHETLISGWPRLAGLADRLRADLILRDWLEGATRDWDRSGQDPGLLIASPARLVEAREAIDARRITFPADSRAFLTASEDRRRQHERQETRRRRLRWGGALAAAIAGVVVAFGWYTLEQRREAELDLAQARLQTELAVAAADAAQDLARTIATAQAETLSRDGRVDEALLSLLDAASVHTDQTAPNALLSALDRVLQRAETETRYAFGPRLRSFPLGAAMWLHDPDDGTLWRVSDARGPVAIATIPGRAQGIGRIDGVDGIVLAIANQQSFVFVAVDETGGMRQLAEIDLFALYEAPDNEFGAAEFMVSVNHDGFALVQWSPFGPSPAYPDHPTAINLTTGASVSLPWGLLDLRLDAAGHSYLSFHNSPDEYAGFDEPLNAIGLALVELGSADDPGDAMGLRGCFRDAIDDPRLPAVLRFVVGIDDFGFSPGFPQTCQLTTETVVLSGVVPTSAGVVRNSVMMELPYEVQQGLLEWTEYNHFELAFGSSLSLNAPALAELDAVSEFDFMRNRLVDADFLTLRQMAVGFQDGSRYMAENRDMDAPILSLAAFPNGLVAVVLETRDFAGPRAGRDLVLLQPGIGLDEEFFVGEPLAQDGPDSFPGELPLPGIVLNPVFPLETADPAAPVQTPSGVIHVTRSAPHETELALRDAAGATLRSLTIPRGHLDQGVIVVNGALMRAAWHKDRQVLVVEADGNRELPLLTLPADAWSVRFLEPGSNQVIVTDSSFSASVWAQNDQGWQSAQTIRSDGVLVSVESDQRGRWLLAKVVDGYGYGSIRLMDRQSGETVRVLGRRYKFLDAWFADPDTAILRTPEGLYRVDLSSFQEYVARAEAALRSDCRVADGAWNTSPCWAMLGR